MNNSDYRRAFTDIMEDVIAVMPIPVVRIFKMDVISPYNWLLYVDDMVYTALSQVLTIGGKSYTVTALDDTIGNNKITVTDATESLTAPVLGTFNLYPFYFFHGTPVDTAQELGGIKEAEDKYPMIWLWEEFQEEMSWDQSTANDRKTTCSLFFLDQADPKLGPTDSRWEAYVKPMYKFRDYFMNYLQSQVQFFMTWDQTTRDTPKNRFGVWLAGKGKEQSLLADNLSGVQMNGIFTIRSNANDFKNC